MKIISQFLKNLALCLGATTLLLSASAQNQATLTPIGKWPDCALLGENMPVRVAGSYAYLAGKAHPLPPLGSSEKATLRLLTLDVSTPSQPRYLSHVDTVTDFSYIWLQETAMQTCGDYAYVTWSDTSSPCRSALAVFSLSEPALPRLVGTLTFSGAVTDVDVVGDHAYVSALADAPIGWLHVIDVSDPAHPTLKTTASVMASPYCVSVAGNYAYVGGRPSGGGYARVEIIDVSNPSQAMVAGGFDMPEYNGPVSAIAAEGSLLHCTPRTMAVPQVFYKVFDRTDPLNPVLIGCAEAGGAEFGTCIKVMGSLVFLGAWGSGCIIDVSDPYNPQIRGRLEVPNSHILDVANHLAYLCEYGQLRVLDVKDPAAPVQVGQLDTGFSKPLISVEGDLACLLDGPRLRVLNVSDPRAPALVGIKDLEPDSCGPGLKMVGQRAYVLGDTFLQSIDLSNPAQPVEAERISLPGGCLDLVGNRAFVGVGDPDPYSYAGWLKIIDVSNAAAPVELGSLFMPDDAPTAAQGVGDYAYVKLYDDHLAIVDIRDPSSMVRVGDYWPNGYFDYFQVVGRYAYVLVHSDSEQSLHIVDLADPANPTRVGRYLYEPGTILCRGLLVSGRHAFVIWSPRWTDDLHVDILDVLDPTQPVKAGEYDLEGSISGMAMVGTTLYATSEAGLTVLDFFAPNTSPRLRLNLPVLASGVAVLTWDGGPNITLQKTASLTNPNWQDVPGTTGQSLAILPQADADFFRLIQP